MNTQILTQTCTKIKGVFTKRLMKTLSVPISSVALLIGLVGSSSAFTITSLESGDGRYTYYSDWGYITHTADVETDEVYSEVKWYVNNVWQTTTQGDGVKKTASFSKGFSGHGPGKTYWIKAVAKSWGGAETASDTYTITVYKNVVAYSGGWSNDLGYAEISECEWNGKTASSNHYASVNNWTSDSVNVSYSFRFRAVHTKVNGDAKEDGHDYARPQDIRHFTVSARSEHSQGMSHSHTLPDIDKWKNGEYVALEVETTVDVKGESKWTTYARAKYYFPVRSE